MGTIKNKKNFKIGDAHNVEFTTENIQGFDQYDGIITAITDEELIAKFTDGTTEKFSWEDVQRMEECFTTVEDQKRVALNVIYEIDNKESINKNNKNLLDWKQIQKKVNMCYKNKNEEITFYEAKLSAH